MSNRRSVVILLVLALLAPTISVLTPPVRAAELPGDQLLPSTQATEVSNDNLETERQLQVAPAELMFVCIHSGSHRLRYEEEREDCKKNEQAVEITNDDPLPVCAHNSNGQLTKATSPDDCKNNETYLTLPWETVTYFCAQQSSGTLKKVDSTDECGNAEIPLYVQRLNTAPVADAQAVSSHWTSPVTITLTGSDAENDPLTFDIVTAPTRGTLGMITPLTATSAEVVYTPTGLPGEDNFTFAADDGIDTSDPATVTVTLKNTAPMADAQAVETLKNTPVTITLTGSDPDGDGLVFAISAGPSHGSLSTLTPITTTSAEIIYTPDTGVSGSDGFEFTVSDGAETSAAATVAITVHNTVPVANDQAVLTNENTPVTITLTGSDGDGDALSFAIDTPPAHGTLGPVTSLDATSAEVVYTPDPDFDGDDGFTFTAHDGDEASLPATVSITVVDVAQPNSPPIADDQEITTIENAAIAITLTGSDSDGDALTFSITTPPEHGTLSPINQLTDSSAEVIYTPDPGYFGDDSVVFEVDDGNGDTGQGTVSITVIEVIAPPIPDLPPDPADVAPTLDLTVASNVFGAASFLYSGPDPIQVGVAPGTIEPAQISVLRGQVRNREGEPLPGIRISVLDHPEYGSTLTRLDGMFDMAVNGGSQLTVKYAKSGYLPAQRQVDTPWQDYAWLPEIVMIPLDPHVSEIDLSAPGDIQIARGSIVTDGDGTRQATLLFRQGTEAMMTFPDGSMQPLSTLHVRATEYTVGESGPQAMPAELPPTSAYTYAVELNADEAVAAGATSIQFSQPVVSYLENFVDFPVGWSVPVGYYDHERGQWIASENGRVIQIVNITDGLANLDTDGDGAADDISTLAALGINTVEQQLLAEFYELGQTLWRMQLSHFSPADYNAPPRLPPDAIDPDLQTRILELLDQACKFGGSIIECQNQVLGEVVDLAGTPFNLHYQSDRAAGWEQSNTVAIPLSESSIPDSLKRIDLVVSVAGRRFEQSFPASPNLSTTFTWDGTDAYGRPLQGKHPVTIEIGYVYDNVAYADASDATSSSFGLPGRPIAQGEVLTEARLDLTLWQVMRATVGTWDAKTQGIAGWTLSAHHVYDPVGGVLYLGTGERRSGQEVWGVVTTVAGNGNFGPGGDGGLATDAALRGPEDVEVGRDGSLYLADTNNNRIRRVSPDGIIITVAGAGAPGYSGDGDSATLAQLRRPAGIALGPDGSLYIADTVNHRIRKVTPGTDGIVNGGPGEIITTIAGTGPCDDPLVGCYGGDGGPALDAQLYSPEDLTVTSDGSLYIVDTRNNRIRRIMPDGMITTAAGTGVDGYSGDGDLAIEAMLNFPRDVAEAPDGTLFIADTGNRRVRRVATDGTISTFAGGASPPVPSDRGDGGPATEAWINPWSIDIGRDGGLYIADLSPPRIRRVGTDGIITTVAGGGNPPSGIGDEGPATQAQFRSPTGVALAPDGCIYVAEVVNNRIRRIARLMPILDFADISIPSDDGTLIYQFDSLGRHLKTINSLTGVEVFRFSYNAEGRLVQIEDGDGNQTTIEWEASGNPAAIVAPFGQRTTLSVDASGYLASVTNEASETVEFSYTDGGLLVEMITPRGGTYFFEYDELGRLTRDTNPVGGFVALERAQQPSGWNCTRINALGDTTTCQVTNLPNGDELRETFFPNGAVKSILIRPDGTQVITDPMGIEMTTVLGPDPRWGMQAPIVASVTMKGSDGRVFHEATTSRTVTLADPNDPLSLLTQTDTVTVSGRTTTTTFDASARTITLSDPVGEQTVTLVDDLGRPLRVDVTNRAPIEYTYDDHGRLVSIVEGTGGNSRTTALVFNLEGFLEQVTDALGNSTTYTYDPVGRVLTETLPTGQVLTYAYDADGNQTSSTDAQGVQTSYEYDPLDRLVATTLDPLGRAVRTEFTYNLADYLIQLVNDAGPGRLNLTTSYEHTALSTDEYLISSVTDPLGNQTDFTYTPFGAISSVTDPLNRTSTTTYTPQGWPESIVTPAGHTTITTYNDDGQPTSVVDPRGVRTEYTYDAAGRLKTVVEGTAPVDGFPALNQTTTYDYDINGRVTSITDARDFTTTYSYDAFGQLSSITDPLGNFTSYAYDALDQLVLETVGDNEPGEELQTTYSYDASGRILAEQVDPDGLNLMTLYRYTHAGSSDTWNLQEVEDPRGNVTIYSYNTLGLLEQTTDALGGTWSYAYDNLGRLINQTDALGRTVTMTYDALGRQTSLTEAARTEQWDYNSDGTLATYTDFASQTTSFSYDADAQLTAIDYPSGTADVSYAYDAAANVVSMVDGLGTTSYTYDALNRLVDRTRNGRTVGYEYNATNQLAQIDYWGRGNVEYAFDGAGRLIEVTPWEADPTTYSYRSTGLLATKSRGNAVSTTYGYDSASRLTSLLHERGGISPDVLEHFQYVLDANGNRTQLTDTDGDTTYAYDALNRLVDVNYPDIPAGPSATTVPYGYDAVGNRLSDDMVVFTYDESNRITNPNFIYDANGNLLNDGMMAYAYDGANRLVETVKDGVTTTYGYDGWGNLIQQTVNGVTTEFVLDERSMLPVLLGEVSSDGREVLYAHGPEGVTAQQEIVAGAAQPLIYPLLDGLGSVRHLTDNTGTLVRSMSYDAFGNIRHSAGTAQSSLGFTGEFTGAVDGLIYLRARHYQPSLGRFLQRDAFPGVLTQSQSLNRYPYAENNPTTFTDPSGHQSQDGWRSAREFMRAAIEKHQWVTPEDEWHYSSAELRKLVRGRMESCAEVIESMYNDTGQDYLASKLLVGALTGQDLSADWTGPTGRNWKDKLADFGAGLGDTLSFGATRSVREGYGIGNVNTRSGWYAAGEYTGTAVDLALGGKGVFKTLGKKGIRTGSRTLGKRSTQLLQSLENRSFSKVSLSRGQFRKSLKRELGALPEGYHRRHVVADEFTRSIIQKALNEAPDLKTKARILRKAGYDPAKFGGDIQKAARKWQLDVFNKKQNVWIGPGKENMELGARGVRIDLPQ